MRSRVEERLSFLLVPTILFVLLILLILLILLVLFVLLVLLVLAVLRILLITDCIVILILIIHLKNSFRFCKNSLFEFGGTIPEIGRRNIFHKKIRKHCFRILVGDGGFGPPKSETTDLQSAPFGRSGNPPYGVYSDCHKPFWSW